MVRHPPLRGAARFRAARALALLLVSALSSGCVPIVQHYERAETADARYLQGLCGGYGPADWTYYPFHGIFISVTVSPIHLGLHYPTSTTVELDSDELMINGSRQGTSIHLIYRLRPALHAAVGAPWRFDAMADPMDPAGRYGYHRRSKGRDFTWANFLAHEAAPPDRVVAAPHDLEGATIVIPAMTINGQKYGSQELPITRKNYLGVIPVNC
jgi:hypothetical protein